MKNKLITAIFIAMTITCYSQNPCPGIPTVTYANKTYNTVQIGEQCWLKENIDAGTMIIGSQDQTNNSILEKYCYDDDPSNCEKYGGLYNWNEAMKYTPSGDKIQGICPGGWRLPTIDELRTLITVANDDGSALKDVTQGVGTAVGTNTSGFSALLAGSRGSIRSNGSYFSHIRVYAFFWSSTEHDASYAYVINLDYSNNTIGLWSNGKGAAFSVRCLKGDGVTSVSEGTNKNEINPHYSLSQNYPNPFNPTTQISFGLPVETLARLVVYDLLGREVSTLINRELSAGYYKINFNGSELPSGIYFYKIEAGKYSDTKKMILIK